jgi:hypothetical protein
MRTLGGPGGDHRSPCSAVLRDGVELARVRPGAQTLPRRPRSLRRRAASRHRDRGGSGRGRPRSDRGRGRVRGNGSGRRPDDHLADRGRLLGHAPASRLPRRARWHSRRGARRGRNSRARGRGMGHALGLPRRSADRRAARVPRPADPASGPPEPRRGSGSRSRARTCGAAGCRRGAGRAADGGGGGIEAHRACSADAPAGCSSLADASCTADGRDHIACHPVGPPGATGTHSSCTAATLRLATATGDAAAVEPAGREEVSCSQRVGPRRDSNAPVRSAAGARTPRCA